MLGQTGNQAAIEHYRNSLALEPTDQRCQSKLIMLLRRQTLLGNWLYMPFNILRNLVRGIRSSKSCLSAMALLIGGGPWFLIAILLVVLFGPVTLAYEVAFVNDPRVTAVKPEPFRFLTRWLARVPYALRVLLLAVVWWGYWTLLPRAFEAGWPESFTVATIWILVCLLGGLIVTGYRKLGAIYGKDSPRISVQFRIRLLAILAILLNLAAIPVLFSLFPENRGQEDTPFTVAITLLLAGNTVIGVQIASDRNRLRHATLRSDEIKLPPAGKQPPLPPGPGNQPG